MGNDFSLIVTLSCWIVILTLDPLFGAVIEHGMSAIWKVVVGSLGVGVLWGYWASYLVRTRSESSGGSPCDLF